MIMASIVDLSPDMPLSFGTYAAVQHAIADNHDFSVNQSRAFSRLNTIFAVFSQPQTNTQREVR